METDILAILIVRAVNLKLSFPAWKMLEFKLTFGAVLWLVKI